MEQKESLLQQIVTIGAYLLLGATSLASFLSEMQGIALVNTFKRALIGSAVIGAIWLAVELLMKMYGLRWRSEKGNVQLRRLGRKPRLAAIGAILIIWVPPTLNLFRPPLEVSALPHVLYDYASNYPDKYFRFKQVKASLSGDLFSNLSFYNNSHYLLEDVEIKIYGHCSPDIGNFLRPYYLDESSYFLMGSRSFKRIEEKKTIELDLLEPFRPVFKSKELLDNFLVPALGQATSLIRLPCPKHEATPLFTSDEKLLQETYIPVVPSNIDMGREAEYGFNGAMLKITLEYVVNDINFKHLLMGGMFYKYIKLIERPGPYLDGPVGAAVSGFLKPSNSLWKRKDDQSYTSISIPQDVVDKIQEETFQSRVGGPFQPGDEISVRMAPGALTSPAGELLPLPMYFYVENKIRNVPR